MIIQKNGKKLPDSDEFMCSLIHNIVGILKNKLRVDWTEPHL
jgi:hypothetical protein